MSDIGEVFEQMTNATRIGNDDIASLLHKASIAFNALPEAAQAKLMEEQRNSWLLGEDRMARVKRLQTVVDNHELQTHANMQDEVEYALTKLEGKLQRINALKQSVDGIVWTALNHNINEAIEWGQKLRTALEKT